MEEVINIKKLTWLFNEKEYITTEDLSSFSKYTINKLVTYKVISSKAKKGKYTILSDIAKINEYDVSLELETLKKTYLYFELNKDYVEAEKYLNKYISLCDKNGVIGHHYYWKQDLIFKRHISKYGELKQKIIMENFEKFQNLINEGKNEEAFFVAQKFLALTRGKNMYSYLLSAIAYNKLEKNEETEYYLTKAQELFPDSPSVFSEFAKLRIRQKKYDDALKYLSNLLKLDGKNFNGYVMLYKAYYLKGEYNNAVQVYNLALKNISSKLTKCYNIKIEAFEKSLFYTHTERMKYIKEILLNEENSFASKIEEINNYVSSIDDCDQNKTLLLFDTLSLVENEEKQVFSETLNSYDSEVIKPYMKKLKTIGSDCSDK